MRVLKVVAEGITTSFRYPHFMQGIHPTFEMPPPATIYGHICSALGEWVEPEGIQFAYHFTYQKTVTTGGFFEDIEHVHILSVASGKLPGTDLPKVLEGNVNPFQRAMLFQPRLTLYLNRPEWEPVFRSPCYAVVLGRSQDLFTYTHVGVVDLEQADVAYFEHTLAPYRLAVQVARGVVVLMPRYLDYANRRAPSFARYVIIRDRVYTDEFLRYSNQSPERYWIDPTSLEIKGMHLGLLFHTFTGNENETVRLA
jgi:CRISPR-associated protein Cas5t